MQLDPSRPDGILGLAQAQFAAGMSKDAAVNFEAGIRRFPKDARIKAQYAVALLRQSETGDATAETRAEQLLRSALALDPSLPDAHYQLGNLALKKGLTTEAQQHLEQAVKLDTHNGPHILRSLASIGVSAARKKARARWSFMKPSREPNPRTTTRHRPMPIPENKPGHEL